MKKYGKKGFTLIELIAVLVIMAIIALIATPLVMSIIRKARVSADKRSIDAYGRSIELAIAGYLLDTGKFPTEVSQLTIEYSGNKVVCSTTQINQDSSVYLAGCTVSGRSVDNYTYGKYETTTFDAYKIGDEVTYNGVDYYVIKDSNASESTITLLKKEVLTTAEVNQYGGVGTANNHVNMYNIYSKDGTRYGTAVDIDGYGAIAYYTSETCKYVNGSEVYDGCRNDYASSEIKYVVDAWKTAQAPEAIDARLIVAEDYEHICESDNFDLFFNDFAPFDYPYWTMEPAHWWDVDDTEMFGVFYIHNSNVFGELSNYTKVFDSFIYFVRPVIVLPKSAL